MQIFHAMKVANFRRDYNEQLKRPKPKKYKGRINQEYYINKFYNSPFQISQRIASYENRQKKQLKHFLKFIQLFTIKIFSDMKNDTLNDLLRSNKDTVLTNLTAKFGQQNYELINWQIVDFSTQDNFRATFRQAVPVELATIFDEIEAQSDSAKRQARKAIVNKLANLTPEQINALLANLQTI